MLDRDTIADLIEAGRLRQATSLEMADEILALLEDPAWAKAMGHPTRAAILRVLRTRGPLSPVRAAEFVDGTSLGSLAYHFRALSELGMIELSDTRQRRGATEHIYALTPADAAE